MNISEKLRSTVFSGFKAASCIQHLAFVELWCLGKCLLSSWALGRLPSRITPWWWWGLRGGDACSWVTWVGAANSGKFGLPLSSPELLKSYSWPFTMWAQTACRLLHFCPTPYSSYTHLLESLECSFSMWFPLHVISPPPVPASGPTHMRWVDNALGPPSWASFLVSVWTPPPTPGKEGLQVSSVLAGGHTQLSSGKGNASSSSLLWPPPLDQGTTLWAYLYLEYNANTLGPKQIWTGMVRLYSSCPVGNTGWPFEQNGSEPHRGTWWDRRDAEKHTEYNLHPTFCRAVKEPIKTV